MASAQRLSASSIPAPAPLPNRPRPRLHVLNAFRHHRFLHRLPGRWWCRARSTSAQRLSASSIPAPGGRGLPVGGVLCSTPFGIIDSCTLISRGAIGPKYQVLNAFRHHRFLHPGRAGEGGAGGEVLNAFRHHRFLHLGIRDFDDQRQLCSTPFGIIDSCT